MQRLFKKVRSSNLCGRLRRGVPVRDRSAQVTCMDSFLYSGSCAEPGFGCCPGILDECSLLLFGAEVKD